MANVFQKVGKFLGDLGSGVTGSLAASNALKEASAAQILANAELTVKAAEIEAERQKRKERMTLLMLLIVFGAPLLGLSLFLFTAKK